MELERVFHRCDGARHDADVGKYLQLFRGFTANAYGAAGGRDLGNRGRGVRDDDCDRCIG